MLPFGITFGIDGRDDGKTPSSSSLSTTAEIKIRC